MYCSDAQGAFDKVEAELLICKLASFNIDSNILAMVSSWLRERSAFVIMNWKRSRPIGLRNVFFQSAVWGPILCNTFFGDCGLLIDACGFDIVVYADDLSAFEFYSRSLSNGTIEHELRVCQRATHR